MTPWREGFYKGHFSYELRRYLCLHGRVAFPACCNKLDKEDCRVENMLVGDDNSRRHSVAVNGSGYIWIPMTALQRWCGHNTYSGRCCHMADRCKLDSLQRQGCLYGWCIVCQPGFDLTHQCQHVNSYHVSLNSV